MRISQGGLRGRLYALFVALAVVVTASVVPMTADVAQAATPQQRLAQARTDLQRLEGRLASAGATTQTAQQALVEAEADLREIEDIVNRVAIQVERQRDIVATAAATLNQLEADRDVLEQQFRERVVQLFKQGPQLDFELLLSAAGVEHAIARTVLLERVLAADRVGLDMLAAAQEQVAAERTRLDVAALSLDDVLEEQQALLRDAEELRNSQALAAADARQSEARISAQRHALEREESQLEAILRRIEAERREAARRGTSPGKAATGSMVWPACGRLTSSYGPRWGRMHRGQDIAAPRGTAIYAAQSGTVVFAQRKSGYGNLVLIDHHNGIITAYAHLNRFRTRVGEVVQRGERIGDMGATGNSTGPHLHFETRVNGSAVNPRQYLSGSVC